MALIDLKSNLAWPSTFTRSNPPQTQGFDANMQVNGQSTKPSQFLEVSNPNNLQLRYNNPILNLQGEQTPNSYIKQPFILRGIQRPGTKAKPQRWGFGIGFDDGFMRGGIVTAVERSLVDVLRLGKWMLTPAGLGWNVKQLGLGFANPKVETVSGTGIPQTRLHIGPATLLSVAGNAFGQHFVSHGMPLVSSLGNYENVQKLKLISNFGNPSNNRLVQLKQELFVNIKTKYSPIIESLSGLGGANSVYGIGRTDIRRYVNSAEGHSGKFLQLIKRESVTSLNLSDDDKPTAVFQYNIGHQYFSLGAQTTYKSGIGIDNSYGRGSAGEISILVSSSNKPVIPNTKTVIDSYIVPSSLSNPTSVIGKYATLAYGKLKRADDQGEPNNKIPKDFRKSIPEYNNKPWIKPNGYTLPNYSNENIEKQYGIGDSGEYNSKDFIKFNFDGITFRAFLDSVSDSFSPTWNAEYDQGRADARILYGAFARAIGLSFRIAVFKKNQLSTIYSKMDQLAKLTMPVYGGETFKGRFCKLTVGNLYRDVPVYIDSLTYDWDSESPWELTDGQQVPMYVSVSVNCTWIGTNRPDQEQPVFSLGSKT